MKRNLMTVGIVVIVFAAGAFIFEHRSGKQSSVPQAPDLTQEDTLGKAAATQDVEIVRRTLTDEIPLTDEVGETEGQADTNVALVATGVPRREGDQFVRELLQEKSEMSEWQKGDLIALAVDVAFTEEERRLALTELIDRILSEDMPRNEKLNTLLAVKDFFVGEERQTIMKTLGMLQDIGGGDAIIMSYLQLPDDETRVLDGARMLTYVGSEATLSRATVEAMIARYGEERSPELQKGLSQAIATAGGDEGMTWFLEQVSASKDFMSWSDMVTTLGSSGSTVAYSYLHQLINTLAHDENYEPHKQLIRSAVTQLRATLEDKGRLPPSK